MSDKPKSIATLLVEIAEDLYVFGCVSEQRGGTYQNPGDDRVAVHTFAAPKHNPEMRRPLADIRTDLAEVYSMTYGSVPNASALGDAMTVLEGKARKGERIGDGDPRIRDLLALFGGGSSVATQLVELAHERYRLGVTQTGEAYAVPVDGPNVARVLRGGRRSLRAELARAYFEKNKNAANASALADALLVLEGEAQGLEPVEVALRVGRPPDGQLVLDLGRDDGAVVVVGPLGWEITTTSLVLFWRTNATLPLPAPVAGGDLGGLRALLNIRDDDWPLILAFLVAALIADVPHPVLLFRGEQGTAKSTAARLLTSLIDRCASQLRTAPRDVEDWCVAAAGSWVTCLDNVSDVQPWLSDAICRAVTGDGLLRRQLYTDSDVSVLAFKRVIALTSVDPGRLAGDLAERLLSVELERIPEDTRKSEEDIANFWWLHQASALGGLLDLAVEVLQILPRVRRTGLPRMADFARVLLAVDKVLGTDGYTTYVEQASGTAEQVAEGDSVAVAIREGITEAWEGTASELLKALTPEKPPRDWPTTPQGMGARLVRAAPSLRVIGWTVEQLPRTKATRRWRITPPKAAEEYPAGTSPPSPSSPTLFDLGKPDDDLGDGISDGDDPTSPGRHDKPAGHDVGDDGDMSAGYSSARHVCTVCGLPMILINPGQTTHPTCTEREQ